MLVKVADKAGKAYTVIGNPIKMDKYPCRYEKMAPELGEDNYEIFKELGFSDDVLSAYANEGIINMPPKGQEALAKGGLL